jgi:hypothetical protein
VCAAPSQQAESESLACSPTCYVACAAFALKSVLLIFVGHQVDSCDDQVLLKNLHRLFMRHAAMGTAFIYVYRLCAPLVRGNPCGVHYRPVGVHFTGNQSTDQRPRASVAG